MELKKGRLSTEFWGIVSVFALVAAKTFGIVPEDASVESLSSVETTQAVFEWVSTLIKDNAPLGLFTALVYAYLRRRTALKGLELKK